MVEIPCSRNPAQSNKLVVESELLIGSKKTTLKCRRSGITSQSRIDYYYVPPVLNETARRLKIQYCNCNTIFVDEGFEMMEKRATESMLQFCKQTDHFVLCAEPSTKKVNPIKNSRGQSLLVYFYYSLYVPALKELCSERKIH